MRSPRVEDLPAQRNHFLLSSTIFKTMLFSEPSVPNPELETQWLKRWGEQRGRCSGGGTVFWGNLSLRRRERDKVWGHVIAYRLDLDVHSVEVFDSNGWDGHMQGAYQSLFAAGIRFVNNFSDPVHCYFVNPFSLPHGGSCSPWTTTYLILRETLGRTQTMDFFLRAAELQREVLAYQLPEGEVQEDDFNIGSLSRAFFLCNARVWQLCYTFIGWTSRGEKTARMLRNAAAIMRVICGCQTYEDVRETLQQCFTPVAPFLPQAFLESVGISFDAETSIIAQHAPSWPRQRRPDEINIMAWAMKNSHAAVMSALLYDQIPASSGSAQSIACSLGVDLL